MNEPTPSPSRGDKTIDDIKSKLIYQTVTTGGLYVTGITPEDLRYIFEFIEKLHVELEQSQTSCRQWATSYYVVTESLRAELAINAIEIKRLIEDAQNLSLDLSNKESERDHLAALLKEVNKSIGDLMFITYGHDIKPNSTTPSNWLKEKCKPLVDALEAIQYHEHLTEGICDCPDKLRKALAHAAKEGMM